MEIFFGKDGKPVIGSVNADPNDWDSVIRAFVVGGYNVVSVQITAHAPKSMWWANPEIVPGAVKGRYIGEVCKDGIVVARTVSWVSHCNGYRSSIKLKQYARLWALLNS